MQAAKPMPEAVMPAPLLEARHVTLRFRGVKALSDVSFAVRAGELFSIIGPNGAGKTSIVNCIWAATGRPKGRSSTAHATSPGSSRTRAPRSGSAARSRTSHCSTT